MDGFFSATLLIYAVTCMVLVPAIAIDGYFKNRDCKVVYDVDQCVVIHVPPARAAWEAAQ
jgi:hypothetical protein